MEKRYYGAKLNDPGKSRFPAINMASVAELPPVVDYSYAFRIDNQGQLGTCVSYGTRKIFDVFATKRTGKTFLVSPRAIYSSAKAQFSPGDDTDDGLAVSDGLSIAKQFYVLESDWPSTMTAGEQDFPQWLLPVPDSLKKTDFIFKDIVRLEDITVDQIRLMLHGHGPCCIGISWMDNWENIGEDGKLPGTGGSVAGGHCINITGYFDEFENLDGTKGAFKIANNWSAEWGYNGYCFLPYNSTSMPTDVYTIRA
jgi:hypothetical protein